MKLFMRNHCSSYLNRNLSRFPEMEKELLIWFTNERDKNRSINGIDIKLTALKLVLVSVQAD
ncbi:hypothetical protein BpHYR1_050032, partial [Brachionus plicatilis]